MKGYPNWYNKKFITNILFLLLLSGLFLVPGVIELKLEIDVPWKLSGNARLWVTAIHVLLSFGAIALLGSLWSIHMRHEWRKRRKIKSGIMLVLHASFLLFSSIGLLYSGNETLQKSFSLLHSGLGILLPFTYLLHLLVKLKTNT